jgi:hypothetical protein
MIFEKNVIGRNGATSLKNQELGQSPVQPVLVKKSNYSANYTQCGDIVNSIMFLSRSLNQMRIDHAIAGQSAVALAALSSSTGTSIELIMSAESYDHFLNVCIHQRIKPMSENDRMFWDHRTGCTLKIHIAGEQIKSGQRAVIVPELNTLLLNDDGIKSWIIESKSVVSSGSRSRRAILSRRSEKETVVAA